jgi:hypothetical protein
MKNSAFSRKFIDKTTTRGAKGGDIYFNKTSEASGEINEVDEKKKL